MTEEILPDAGGDSVRDRLAAIGGVDAVVIDEERRQVWLILRADADPHAVEQEAADLTESYELHVGFRPERRDRQRVRFVDVQRQEDSDQHVRFVVTLEWAGVEYTGMATGERGGAVELRTIAASALEAVSAVVRTDFRIKLAGVKQVRAFDADLIVVSLYRPDASPHNLVGVVVTGDDVRRAAAVAVLSALNRILGNFLLQP